MSSKGYIVIDVWSIGLSSIEMEQLKKYLFYCAGWYYNKTNVFTVLNYKGNYKTWTERPTPSWDWFNELSSSVNKPCIFVASSGIDSPNVQDERGRTYADGRAYTNLGHFKDFPWTGKDFDANSNTPLDYFLDNSVKLFLHECYHLLLLVLGNPQWNIIPHQDPETKYD